MGLGLGLLSVCTGVVSNMTRGQQDILFHNRFTSKAPKFRQTVVKTASPAASTVLPGPPQHKSKSMLCHQTRLKNN